MAYENGNARLIRGVPVSNTLPENGQAPVYNSSTGQYEPTTVNTDITASEVANVPSGSISSTDVQAAINELDSEKEPVISAGTTAQYWRGDKTFQSFDNAAAAVTTLTGIISGGVGTLNTDTTKIDITACTYYIQGVKYTYAGGTAISNGFGAGENSRFFGLDSTGLVSQSTRFTASQKQTILPLVRINAVQGQTGSTAQLIPPLDQRFLVSETGYLQRIWQEEAIGVLYYTGGLISESATPRQVNESAGAFYDAQRKRQVISGSTNIQAIPIYHVASAWTAGTKTTLVVDNLQYDNGTGLTTLSNNKWASHTLLKSPKNSDEFFFVYSQAQYASQAEAAAAPADYGVFSDQATSGLVAIAKIIIQKSAANVNQFVDLRPFIGGRVGAVLGTSTLQQTYDNSTTPEILTDATRGALSIKRGSAADTDNIFEGQNGSGTTTFSVTGAGVITGSNLSGTNTGDQNLFSTIAVSGQSNVVADSTSDTLTLVAGTNITITTDASTDSITINSTGGGGLSWGSSINGATGTGLALSMDNSYAASGIGQSITIGNTQTNALDAFVINTGSSTSQHTGIRVIKLNAGSNDNSNAGISINSFASATQAVSTGIRGLAIGSNFNTTGAFLNYNFYLINEDNSNGSGANQGITIINNSRDKSGVIGAGFGSAIKITQNGTGAGATSIYLSTGSNINASTYGLVNYTLSNTQSGATVMQKIDLGTSAQGHFGHLVLAYGASTSQRGMKIDLGSTGTGYGIEILMNTSTNTNNTRGIYLGTIQTGASGNKYGIYTDYIVNGNGTGYGMYTDYVNISGGGTSYGIYQNVLSGGTNGVAYGWYVANIGTATAGNVGKYFSLNNAQSGNLQDRTNDAAEILWSRTSTITTGTDSDNFNLVNFRRTSVMNGVGGTFTAAGSVLKLENVATQTAGTLTDSVAILSLVQDNDSTGGHILFNSYSGTPTTNGTFWFDGSDLKLRAGGVTYTITKT